jgi:hypothetical protein
VLPKHIGHEHAGLAPLRALCERLKVPAQHRDLAKIACREHLNVHRLFELRDRTVHELLARCDGFRQPARIAQLALVCEADKRGRAGLQDEPYPQARRNCCACSTPRCGEIRGRDARRPRRPGARRGVARGADPRDRRGARVRSARSTRSNASRIGVSTVATGPAHAERIRHRVVHVHLRVVVSVPARFRSPTPSATRNTPRATRDARREQLHRHRREDRVTQQVFELVAARRQIRQQQRRQQRTDDHRGDHRPPRAEPTLRARERFERTPPRPTHHRRQLRSPARKATPNSTSRWKPIAWKRSPISPGNVRRLASWRRRSVRFVVRARFGGGEVGFQPVADEEARLRAVAGEIEARAGARFGERGEIHRRGDVLQSRQREHVVDHAMAMERAQGAVGALRA